MDLLPSSLGCASISLISITKILGILPHVLSNAFGININILKETPQADFSVMSIPTLSEPTPVTFVVHKKVLHYNCVGIISRTQTLTSQIDDIAYTDTAQHPSASSCLSPTNQQTRESLSSSPLVICGEAPGIKPDSTTQRLTRHTSMA